MEIKPELEQAELNADHEIDETAAIELEKSTGKKLGRLSKKKKLLTAGVNKIVGGTKKTGGGWDANHNEILV